MGVWVYRVYRLSDPVLFLYLSPDNILGEPLNGFNLRYFEASSNCFGFIYVRFKRVRIVLW
jgi:hypothetical protein